MAGPDSADDSMAGPNSADDSSLPTGWTEMEAPEATPGKYDARPEMLFEREGEDVAVEVFPSEPNAPHADTDRWRVAVVYGTVDDPDRVDPVADVDGSDAALDVAKSFMEAYEDADGADRVERAVEAVSR